jgi:recombination protein RecA
MAKKTDKAGVKAELLKLIKELKKPEPVEWMRTGIHALDLILGGGIPVGRIIEIFGPELSTKSTLAWMIGKVVQQRDGAIILCDAEATEPVENMEKLGVDTNFVFRPNFQIETVEQVRDFVAKTVGDIRAISKDIPIVVIWDSIAATQAEDEWKDFEGRKLRDTEIPGVRARAIASYLRQNTGWFKEQGVTMICVNQLRDKIGVMFGRKNDSTGGRALKYGASIRLELIRSTKLKDGEDTKGFIVIAHVHKHKFAPPFRKTELEFRFASGFDNYIGLEDVLESAGRIKKIKGGGVIVGEEKFATVKEATEKHPELLENWTNG